jgi:hypothetical protein
MNHLSDERLVAWARSAQPGAQLDPHLADCRSCRARLASTRNLATATAAAAEELTGPVTPPSFEALLGPALASRPVPNRAGEPASEPIQVVSPGLGASWRLLLALVLRQASLLPRVLPVLSALCMALALTILPSTRNADLAQRFFASAVTLVVVAGSLAVCSMRIDPRQEVLAALPISPGTVLTARLALVLSVDLVLALASSTVASHLDGQARLAHLVTLWLGQALLASAVAVLGAIWRSPLAGGSLAALVWLLGSAGTLPSGLLASRLGPVIAAVWSTSPYTLAASLALFAVSVAMVRARRRDLPLSE